MLLSECPSKIPGFSWFLSHERAVCAGIAQVEEKLMANSLGRESLSTQDSLPIFKQLEKLAIEVRGYVFQSVSLRELNIMRQVSKGNTVSREDGRETVDS